MSQSGTGAPRFFTQGETIHLRSRVSIPGTRTPIDPSTVALTSMVRNKVQVLEEPLEFTREGVGEFTLSLPTSGLAAGTYEIVVTHADGPDRVTLATDRFVLRG